MSHSSDDESVTGHPKGAEPSDKVDRPQKQPGRSTATGSAVPVNQHSWLSNRKLIVDWTFQAILIFVGLLGVAVTIGGYFIMERFQGERPENIPLPSPSGENPNAIIFDNPDEFKVYGESPQDGAQNTLEDRILAKAEKKQLSARTDEEFLEAKGAWEIVIDAAGLVGDKDLSSRAWFSVGHLIQEKDPKYQSRNAQTIGEVVSAYNKALKLNPVYALAYNNRGAAKYDLEDYKGAIEDYDQALKLDPDHAGAYGNRALAKFRLGNYEAAIADYDEVLKLRPGDFEAYNNRGAAKYNLGDHVAAIADYDEVLKLRPANARAYNNRGLARSGLGHYGRAIEDYGESLRLNPGDGEVYYNRGKAEANMGHVDRARADFGTALGLAERWGLDDMALEIKKALHSLDEN